MAQITDIKAQARRADRVSIYLDDDFWTGVGKNALLELGIAVGDELDEGAKRDLEQQIGRAEALYYCMDRLAERAMSRHQLAGKLAARGYGPEVVDACLDVCVDMLVIDDEQFARDAAEARRDSGHGPGKVRDYLLHTAGVDRDLVDAVIAEMFDADSVLDRARSALASRFTDEELTSDQQRRATAFLLRRGFGMSEARAVVAERAMSRADEQLAEDPAEAARLLSSKYGAAISDRRVQSKAWAFLARRGWSSASIRRAVEIASSAG